MNGVMQHLIPDANGGFETNWPRQWKCPVTGREDKLFRSMSICKRVTAICLAPVPVDSRMKW
jgi:hypothetical protein